MTSQTPDKHSRNSDDDDVIAAADFAPHQTNAPTEDDIIRPAEFVPLTKPQTVKTFYWRRTYTFLTLAIGGLAAAVIFLLTTVSISVSVEPPDADIAVKRWPSVKLGNHYVLWPGDANIEIKAQGYHPLSETVTVTREDNQRYHFALEKLPGQLLVTVNHSANNNDASRTVDADVWLNNMKLGKVNQVLNDIPAGEHELTITSERYLPYSTTLTIVGMGESQTHTVELQPAWATVAITSIPEGATLSVDGVEIGQTPLQAEIIQGEREIKLSLSGYKSWDDYLEVAAGESLSLEPVTLAKADGLITIQSRPSQASITVNGNYYGLTPQEIALPPGQTYNVTLFKEGYQAAHQKTLIESGKAQTLDVALEANLGTLRVQANPEDALIYVNGRLMGRANQTLTLPTTQTHIVVKKDGYADHTTTVIPRSNYSQSLSIKLKTLEEAKWENIPSVITTHAGQTLKLFKVDDTFTMGSSRREQGRRANEAMRTATLSRAFYLGTHEVTNAQFRQFLPTHSSSHVKGNSLDNDNYPVVNITWEQAALYCNWLSEKDKLPAFYQVEDGKVVGFNSQSNGYRLQTEAEWAWAARHHNNTMLKFPWGDQLEPPEKAGNFADRSAAPVAGYILNTYDDGYVASAPVGSFPANHKGLYDLAGNVAEWVHDFYDVGAGLSQQATTNPLGPTEGAYHVIRGASWQQGSIPELRLSFRDYSDNKRSDVGFRIARYVD